MTGQTTLTARERLRDALTVCAEPRTVGRTCRIALVVGIVLTAINEGDVVVGGQADPTIAVKIALNFVVPLVVSNLGVLAARR